MSLTNFSGLGLVTMDKLNIGENSIYDLPKSLTRYVSNGAFTLPAINSDYSSKISISNWIIEGADSSVFIYKNNDIPEDYVQYIGLSNTNESIKQSLNITNSGNYNITFYAKQAIGIPNVNVRIENTNLNSNISLTNEWTLYSFNFSITVPGIYDLRFVNIQDNTLYYLTGVNIYSYELNNTDYILDVSGSAFIKNGMTINVQNNDSNMVITSNNLNITSNTTIKNDVVINKFTNVGIVHNDKNGKLYSGLIVNDDVSNLAKIADYKLDTISSSGKVANSATSANLSNVPNTIALRDQQGYLYATTADISNNSSILATTEFVNLLGNNLVSNKVNLSTFNTFAGNTSIDLNKLYALNNNLSNKLNGLVRLDASENLEIGNNSLLQKINGNNNTLVGYTGVDVSVNVYNNSTALGYGATINSSNQIVIGTSLETVNIPNLQLDNGVIHSDSYGNLSSSLIVNDNIEDNTIDISKFVQSQLSTSSIANTLVQRDQNGDISAITQAQGDNTTKVATTEFVRNELNNLSSNAPELLDTLSELANAVNNDASFAYTILNNIDSINNSITNLNTRVDSSLSEITTYVDQQDSANLNSSKSYTDSSISSLKTYVDQRLLTIDLSLGSRMSTIIGGYAEDIRKGNTTYFGTYVGGFGIKAEAAEADAQMEFPINGTLSRLYIYLSAAAGQTGSSYTFKVRKNGIDTSLNIVINDVNRKGSDLVNSVTFTTGDLFSVAAVPKASGSNTVTDNLDVRWVCKFTPT